MRRKKLPEVLNSFEASKLLSIPNTRYPTGLRNLAILTVMINMGLRVSEAFNLKPGNINLTECDTRGAVLDNLVEAGIDAYHTLEVKAGMDVVELKKKYKNKLAYLGNMDALNILPGSKEDLKKDLLYRLNAAKGGGYMPGADHSVPGNVPAENYDYFIDLIRKFGKYPINLGKSNIGNI